MTIQYSCAGAEALDAAAVARTLPLYLWCHSAVAVDDRERCSANRQVVHLQIQNYNTLLGIVIIETFSQLNAIEAY